MSASNTIKKSVIDPLVTKGGGLVVLTRKLISSGEGAIFGTSDPMLVAKIYHHPSPERGEKLKVMLARSSVDSVAWPVDLVYERGEVVGFLMPKIRKAKPLPYFYHPRLRQHYVPHITWYHLHNIAFNIAKTMTQLHETQVIVGDIKAENILIYADGSVCFLDTDSFQIIDPETKKIFKSSVGSEGYIPPELIGKQFSKVVRTQVHDRFGLAVLLYHLLFGEHPFKGVWHGEGDPASIDERVYKGLTPWRKQKLVSKSPLSLSPSILSPELRIAFEKAFTEGHLNPSKRPSAREWAVLLQKSGSQLALCMKNKAHFFYDSSPKCPWCEYGAQTGIDLFKNPLGLSKEDQFSIEKSIESALRSANFDEARRFLRASCLSESSKKGYEAQIEEAQAFKKSLTPLIELLEASPRNDQEICQFWELFPSKNSHFFKWRGFFLKEEDIRSIVHRSIDRSKTFKEFRALVDTSKLLNRSPLFYFDALLQLFNSLDIEPQSTLQNWPEEWNELEKKVQTLKKKYSFLKKAILEESSAGILQYWEEGFEKHIEREGLAIPLKVILASYFDQVCQSVFDETSLRLEFSHDGWFLYGIRCCLPFFLQNKALPIRSGVMVKDSKEQSNGIFIEDKEFIQNGGKVYLAATDGIKRRRFLAGVFKKSSSRSFEQTQWYAQGCIGLGSTLFVYGDTHPIVKNAVPGVIYYQLENWHPWRFWLNCWRRSLKKKKGFRIQFYAFTDQKVPEVDVVLHPFGKQLLNMKLKESIPIARVESFQLTAFQKTWRWIDADLWNEIKEVDFRKVKLTLAPRIEKSAYYEHKSILKSF